MADHDPTPRPRAKSHAILALDLAVPLALAMGITAMLMMLIACAPAPQPPAKASIPVKRAPVLTADAREWCKSFGYQIGSTSFDSCTARWSRAEKFATQKLREQGDEDEQRR